MIVATGHLLHLIEIGGTTISIHPGFLILWVPILWIAWRATGGWRD